MAFLLLQVYSLSFNPSSNLVSYWDYNSCGPRGDDAKANLVQCQHGHREVEKGTDVHVNGCHYFEYTVYECKPECLFFRNGAKEYLDSNAARDVYTHSFNGGNNQKWNIFRDGNDFLFENRATLLYLDSNTAGDVYTLPYNGGNYQRWTATYNGNYYIFKNKATGKVLDAGYDVFAHTLNGGLYQQWTGTDCSD